MSKPNQVLFTTPRGTPITREDAIETLVELRDMTVKLARLEDPLFLTYPDVDTLLEYIKQHGLPGRR